MQPASSSELRSCWRPTPGCRDETIAQSLGATWERQRNRAGAQPEMDVHDREGPHQNGPRLSQTSRYPRALYRRGELLFANSKGNAEYHQVLVQRMLGRTQLKAGLDWSPANRQRPTVPG